ncbi:hypothetical protein GKQ38_02395 [Candidatus Nanohaloarchaea archaeon]|nr:hypothetical protein GKQ38_02395 [Candidatus Nanohaloarchaea archaeon]
MFEERGLEVGIFAGLAVALAGSVFLPALQLISTVAGAAVAAFLLAKNGKEGLLTGSIIGFTLLFFGVINLYYGSVFPTEGIFSSAIGFAPFDTTMKMFVFASAYVLVSSVLAGAVTGFLKYEEDYEFATV